MCLPPRERSKQVSQVPGGGGAVVAADRRVFFPRTKPATSNLGAACTLPVARVVNERQLGVRFTPSCIGNTAGSFQPKCISLQRGW